MAHNGGGTGFWRWVSAYRFFTEWRVVQDAFCMGCGVKLGALNQHNEV